MIVTQFFVSSVVFFYLKCFGFLKRNRMLSKTFCLGIVFLAVTTIGTIANVFLFKSYRLNIFAGHKISSLMPIFTQLSLVNSVMLVSKGIPQILQGLGWNYFLDDVGCKVIFYLCKLSEGLSISLTSLLCALQAISISPSNSRWTELKVRGTQQTTLSYLFCWIINLLIEILIILSIRGPRSSKNITNILDGVVCTLELSVGAYVIITCLRNVLCLGLIVLASGYMVLLLHKHHQRIQKIQNTNLPQRRHPEIRVTQTVLLLMSTFVSFYALTSILTLFTSSFNQKFPWMLATSIFLSLCYLTISPFVLIPRALKNASNVWVKKNHHFHTCLNCNHGGI